MATYLDFNADSTALSGPSSTNKRRRESDSGSLTTFQPSSSATFVTGPVPAALSSSASSSIPPQLPDATSSVAPPPSPGSQPLEESFGPFQTYRDLAPIPESVINGVPIALMNCGYHPWRLARSLLDAVLVRGNPRDIAIPLTPSLMLPSSRHNFSLQPRTS